MNITITPTQLQGSITPPPSKSQAHQLIIAPHPAEAGRDPFDFNPRAN